MRGKLPEIPGLPYVSAALFFIFYLLNAPVYFALAAQPFSFGLGVGFLRTRGAIRRARNRMTGHTPKKKPNKKASPLKKPVLRAFRYALGHSYGEWFSVRGNLGLTDAKNTALAVGALNGLCLCLGPNASARVRPDFSRRAIEIQASAIISIRIGHLLWAAWIYCYHNAIQYLKRKTLNLPRPFRA